METTLDKESIMYKAKRFINDLFITILVLLLIIIITIIVCLGCILLSVFLCLVALYLLVTGKIVEVTYAKIQ